MKKSKAGKEEIILIGGGGHCKVIIDAVAKGGKFKIKGIIDADPGLTGVLGIRVLGSDRELAGIYRSGCRKAFIAVGSVGDPNKRVRIDEQLRQIGFELPVIIHPNAVIAGEAEIAAGSFIAAGAVLGPQVKIGRNVIVNTRASVDHDCVIGDFVHLAPGAVLSGGVEIGERTHIGTGATVIEYKKIGAGTVIGAGSNVVSDIPGGSVAFGNPCEVVKKNER